MQNHRISEALTLAATCGAVGLNTFVGGEETALFVEFGTGGEREIGEEASPLLLAYTRLMDLLCPRPLPLFFG
jgi:hypothetical protein